MKQPQNTLVSLSTKPKPPLTSTRVCIKGKTYFKVYVGKRFRGGEPAQVAYFQSAAEAKTFIRQQITLRENQGTVGLSLSDRERIAAADGIKKLASVGADLDDAVNYYLRHAKPAGGTKNFKDAEAEFRTSRAEANRRVRYLTNLKSQFRIIKGEFAEILVNEITHPNLRCWIDEQAKASSWSAKTKNNYIVTLRAFFDFCIAQDWCTNNPAEKLTKSTVDEGPAACLTVPQVIKFITNSVALGATPEFVAVVCISIFSGLRRSEVCALLWNDIKDDVIDISSRIAKQRQRRLVDISDNLKAWLAPLRRASGRIFSGSEDDYNAMRAMVAEGSQVDWPRNALRSTCASYHFAFHQNPGYTAIQLGHSMDVLYEHYREVVTKANATDFWNIYPYRDVRAGEWIARVEKSNAATRRLTSAYNAAPQAQRHCFGMLALT